MSPYLIVAPWIVFGAYWVINAWSVKATAERQSLASALPNRCLTLAGGILLFWRSQPHPFETRIIPNTMTAGCSGLGLCLLGLALAIWSRNTLGRNWSSVVTLKKEHELVERGPYRFVRHPIYSAILLMSTGTAVAFGRLGCWLGVPFLFWGFWLKLRQEEALLTRNFPAEYPGYMKRVKALVPYVFMWLAGLFALERGTARSADAIQPGPTAMQMVMEHGWGYALVDTYSIQAYSGGGFGKGIVEPVGRGEPKKSDDWGALAACRLLNRSARLPGLPEISRQIPSRIQASGVAEITPFYEFRVDFGRPYPPSFSAQSPFVLQAETQRRFSAAGRIRT